MEKEQKISLETKRSSFSTRQTQEGRDAFVVNSQDGREICDCKVNDTKETHKSKSRVWKTVMWFTRKSRSGKIDGCQCDEVDGECPKRDLGEETGQVEQNVHSNSWSFTRTASRKLRISLRKRRCKSASSRKSCCCHREHASPSGSLPKSGAYGGVRCAAGSPTATGSFCDFGSNGCIGSGAARKTKRASFLTEIARELNPPAGRHPLKEVDNRRPSGDLSKSLSSNFGGCTAESLSPMLHQNVRRCKSFPGPFSNSCAFKRRNIDQQSGDAGYCSPPSKQKCRGHRRTATFGGKPSTEFMSIRVKKSKSVNTTDFMKLEKTCSSLGEIRDQDGSIVGIVHFYKSPKSSCMRRLNSFNDGITPRKLSMSEEFSGPVKGIENQRSTRSDNEEKMDLNCFDGTLESTVSFPICFPSSQDPINCDVSGIADSAFSESLLETNLNLSRGSRNAISPTLLQVCQAVEELESEQPSSALQNSQNPYVDSCISESNLEGNLSLSPVPKRCISPMLPSQTISLLDSQNSEVDEVDDSSFSETNSSPTLPSKTTEELERRLTFEPEITAQPEKCLNSTIRGISVVQDDDAMLDSVESIRVETDQKHATAIQDISESIEERNKNRKINSHVHELQKPLNDAYMSELADGCLTSDDKNRNQIISKVHLDPSNDGYDPMSEGYISLDDTFSHDININRYINKDNRNEEDGGILSACNSSCATAQSSPNGVARLQDICENHTFKLHENSFTGGTSDDEMVSTDSSETDVIAQIQQDSDELGSSSSKESCVGNRIIHEEGLTFEGSIGEFTTGKEQANCHDHENMCISEASEKLETVWEQATPHEEVVQKGMGKAQKFSTKAKSSTSHQLHDVSQVVVNSPMCHKCDYEFTRETKSHVTYSCEEVDKKSISFGSSGIVAPVNGAKVPESLAQVLENSSTSDYASCSDEELSNSDDNALSIWKTAEQAGLKEEDLRLPVPGKTFKMRTELILRWFEEFNDEQKNIVMKKLLNRCELPQMHLLSVAMEPKLHKSCPPNCQDMLVWLPYPVTLKILMYLDPVSLCQCNQVNKAWNELTNNPLLWKQLTRSTDYQLSEASSRKQYLKYTLPNGNIHWKKVLAERYLLQRNWLNGKYTLRTYEGHHQGIACVQFDDTRIVSGSSDKTIKLWDISNTNSELMLTLEGHSGTVRCLDLNGNRLVSGSTDCTIKVWDLSFASYWAGASCKVTMVGHLHTVRCLQADDKKLVSGSYDKTVKVWDLKTGECRLTLRGHTAAVLCVQFDDQKIVSGSYDKKIKVWDLTEGTCLMTLDGHQDAVTCLNLTHDGMKIITGSLDYSLKFWDLFTGKCYGTLDWITSEGHTAVVRCLQVDSWRIISGGDDKTLKVWELATGQRLLTLRYHSDGVTCMQFNDFAIVSGSYDRTVKLWDFTPQHPYLEMVLNY